MVCARLRWVGPAALACLAACTVGTGATNFTAMMLSPFVTSSVEDTDKVPDARFPVYGGWCGSGHPPPEDADTELTLPPPDALDAACMKHDLCYRAHGKKPACSCNEDFVWRAKYLQHRVPDLSGDARAAISAVLTWFATAPCWEPPDEQALPRPVAFCLGTCMSRCRSAARGRRWTSSTT